MRYLAHCYSWFKGESEKQIQAIRNADRNLRDANLVNVLGTKVCCLELCFYRVEFSGVCTRQNLFAFLWIRVNALLLVFCNLQYCKIAKGPY